MTPYHQGSGAVVAIKSCCTSFDSRFMAFLTVSAAYGLWLPVSRTARTFRVDLGPLGIVGDDLGCLQQHILAGANLEGGGRDLKGMGFEVESHVNPAPGVGVNPVLGVGTSAADPSFVETRTHRLA